MPNFSHGGVYYEAMSQFCSAIQNISPRINTHCAVFLMLVDVLNIYCIDCILF